MNNFRPYAFEGRELEPQTSLPSAFRTLPFGTTDFPAETHPYGPRPRRGPPSFSQTQGLSGVMSQPSARTTRSMNQVVTNHPAPFATRGLGVPPLVAGGVIAAGAVIGGLFALVEEYLEDSWQEAEVYQANTTTIHNAMKTIQCLVGGAVNVKSFGCDAQGKCICPGGTQPICRLPDPVLSEWRLLRREWSEFYGRTGSTGTSLFGGATEGEALTAKQFAVRMADFYKKIETLCPEKLPSILPGSVEEAAKPTTDETKKEAPAWLKWTVAGVVGVAAVIGFKAVSDVFGD